MFRVINGNGIWNDLPVLITGHTGFKGGWMSLWLKVLGAKLHGYALDPPSTPSFFESTNLSTLFETDGRGDIADYQLLERTIRKSRPEVIFHFAAQPLVRMGYDEPLHTVHTNVIGTCNLMQSVRMNDSVRTVVIVSTDKVYENLESDVPYKESDKLGGQDPYSASKAASELLTTAFYKSYFSGVGRDVRVVCVRAGNVIGGGDWSKDRLVPDCIRSLSNAEPVTLRQPNAVRPWQHVLEPLSGYLLIVQALMSDCEATKDVAAFNFGPPNASHISAAELVNRLVLFWGDNAAVHVTAQDEKIKKENSLLHLDSSLAQSRLNWRPRWSLDHALKKTAEWYRCFYRGDDMRSLSLEQLTEYIDKCN